MLQSWKPSLHKNPFLTIRDTTNPEHAIQYKIEEPSATLTFTWNTTGYVYGNYTVWAYAEPVEGETYLEDNTFVGGWVFVAGPGDVNADAIVDIFDCVLVASAFGSAMGDSNWSPNTDVNSDLLVDIFDLVTVAGRFGETYTYP